MIIPAFLLPLAEKYVPKLVKWVFERATRATREPEEPSQPLSWKDVEHIQEQIKTATGHSRDSTPTRKLPISRLDTPPPSTGPDDPLMAPLPPSARLPR